LKSVPISNILPTEEDTTPLLDKAHVCVTGMITSVTVKTTRKDERMAFFTIEDASGEIECLAFPKIYGQDSDIIRADYAVFVEGNLSLREEEAPKILVSGIGLLVDDEHYKGGSICPAPTPHPGRRAASAPNAEATAQQGDVPEILTEKENHLPIYNPYEAMMRPAEPRAVPLSNAPQRRPGAPSNPVEPHKSPVPTRVYLRVSDMTGETYQKTENLVRIFCDGTTEVVFYDASVKKYIKHPVKIRWSLLVKERMIRILGSENVVEK